MFSSTLAKRIEPHDLLALFSVEIPRALPTLSKCPVCGSPACLETTYGHGHAPTYWCRNPSCWFQGDGIQLYRAVTHKTTREACYDLIAARVLPRDGDLDREITNYLADLEQYQDRVWSIWERARNEFRSASSGVSGLMQDFRCWESATATCGIGGFGNHLGCLRGSDIKNLPGVPKHVELYVRSGQYYLVLPLWLDRWVISGFVFVGHGNQQLHWQVWGREAGIGLLHTTAMNEATIVSCDCAAHAIQLISNGISSAYKLPVTYIHDDTSNWGYLLAQRRVLLNTTKRPALYRKAIPFPECQILTGPDLDACRIGSLPHPRARLEAMSQHGYPTFRAIAVLLCGLGASQAAATIQALELQPAEIQRVIASTPEHMRESIQTLFRQQPGQTTIKFQNETITCGPDGWRGAKKGLICNTMFFVDQIVCDTSTHQGTAIGTVIQGDREFKFSSPIKDVELHTQEWLRDVLAQNRAGWLEILPGWASRLFAISRMFRQPQTLYTSNAVGWVENGHRLVFPNLVVEGGSVQSNPHPIQGANCGVGLIKLDIQASQLESWVKDDEAGHIFWAMFGLLCHNLLTPFHNYGSFGIGLLDRAQGLLSGMALDLVDQVGLERITFRNTGQARMQEIWKLEQRSPLPLYIDETWASNEGFVKWLSNKQTRNCLVMMSKPVAIGTCLDGGWAYIRSSVPVSDARSRYLQAWNLIPHYMAWHQANKIEWPAIRSAAIPTLFGSIAEWLISLGLDPRVLKRAQDMIEVDMLERTSSWGSKFLSLLIESVECGLVPIKNSEQLQGASDCIVLDQQADLVFISRATLTRLMGQMGLPVPPHQHIQSMLQASKALCSTRYRETSGYAIPLDQWSLYYSLRGSR